jgi:hypothetical protein
MRTLQTSLEFRPLLNREELLNECTGLIRFLQREQAGPYPAETPKEPPYAAPGKESFFYLARSFGTLFRHIVTSLDRVSLVHEDGMETRLFAGAAQAESPRPSRPDGEVLLRGVFHPRNKAYTIPLVPAFE